MNEKIKVAMDVIAEVSGATGASSFTKKEEELIYNALRILYKEGEISGLKCSKNLLKIQK